MIIMKKLISLILVLLCLCSLAACAKDQPKVWGWAQNLNRENVSSVEIWSTDDENIPLDETQILELVTLLNHLSKGNFTENKKLVGITPLVGIKMQIDAEIYHINYAPSPNGKHGMLEISYGEKLWWIDDAALLDYFMTVIDGKQVS